MIEGNLKIMKAGSLSALCVALATLAGCGSDDIDALDRTRPVGTESLAVISPDSAEELALEVIFPLQPLLIPDPDLDVVTVNPTSRASGGGISGIRTLSQTNSPSFSALDEAEDEEELGDVNGGVFCGYTVNSSGDPILKCLNPFVLKDGELPQPTVDPDEIYEVDSETVGENFCSLGGVATLDSKTTDVFLIKDDIALRSLTEGELILEDCSEIPNIQESADLNLEYRENYETGEYIYQWSNGYQTWVNTATGEQNRRDYSFLRTTLYFGEEAETFSFRWSSALTGDSEMLVTTMEPLVYPIFAFEQGDDLLFIRDDLPVLGKIRIQGGSDSELLVEIAGTEITLTYNGEVLGDPISWNQLGL